MDQIKLLALDTDNRKSTYAIYWKSKSSDTAYWQRNTTYTTDRIKLLARLLSRKKSTDILLLTLPPEKNLL